MTRLPRPLITRIVSALILILCLASAGYGAMAAPSHQLTAKAGLTPFIRVDPSTFAADSAIKISGHQFAPFEIVHISLTTLTGSASLPIGTAKTNATGTLSYATAHVPFGIAPGKLLVVVAGVKDQASVPVTVVGAQPSLVASATSLNPGGTLSVTGAHFMPGEAITLDLVTLTGSTRVGAGPADASGGFSISGVTIPQNTPQGTASLVATGSGSHLSATAQITVGAAAAIMSLNPASLTAGNPTHVTGSGFIPGETVTIQIVGGTVPAITLGSVVAGTDGTFTINALAIPTFLPSASYSLVASGQGSGRSAKSTLQVQAPASPGPIISILNSAQVNGGPYRLTPGGLVQLVGSHFPAGADVTLSLAAPAGTVVLGTLRANASGALGPQGFTLPATTPLGDFTLQATIAGNKVASVATTVAALAPHITLSTGDLTPGALVTIQGTGYAAGEQIVLALNGSALTTLQTTVLADTNGAFTVAFRVPATVNNGSNIIIASGVNSRATASAAATATLPVATQWYFPNTDTTGGAQVSIALLNATGASANIQMTFLYGAGPERQYTTTVGAHSQASINVTQIAGSDRHISTIVEANRQISAESVIDYAGADNETAIGATGPATRWYLAEGYTNGSFREQLEIMNPATSFATVDVQFLPFNNRPAREVRFVMQPRSNIQVDAAQYMPSQSISAIVSSNKGIVVERTMRFGAGGRGLHDKIGVTAASTVWFFAEGRSYGNRQTFFTILNPNVAAPAAVTATFFDKTGRPVGTKTIVVDPLHRGNIKLNEVVPNGDVASILTSNVPVVIERPLYEGPANLGLAQSGSVIFGRNGGAMNWTFPLGSTASGDNTELFLFNPGLKPVAISATFYTTLGAMVSTTVTLAPNSLTVLHAGSVAGLPATTFGTVLKSTNDQVFIAEETITNSSSLRDASTQGVAQ